MAKTVEELRVESAEKLAKVSRDAELERRKAIKAAQVKAEAGVHRPLVTAGGGMPPPETPPLRAGAEENALQAHHIRTQGRIETWERKLADPKLTPGERTLIEEEVRGLQLQLSDPRTRASIERDPVRSLGPAVESPNPLMELVLSLKAKVDRKSVV